MNRKTFIKRRFGFGDNDDTYLEIIRSNKNTIVELENTIDNQQKLIENYLDQIDSLHKIILQKNIELNLEKLEKDALQVELESHKHWKWPFKRILQMIFGQ